jgi:hypothetical protein
VRMALVGPTKVVFEPLQRPGGGYGCTIRFEETSGKHMLDVCFLDTIAAEPNLCCQVKLCSIHGFAIRATHPTATCQLQTSTSLTKGRMKLLVLLVIAFVVVVATVDAHDDSRMLQTGRREGNARARAASTLEDARAAAEKKAREEKKALEEKRAREKKAEEERKAREKKAEEERKKKAEEEKKKTEENKSMVLPVIATDPNAQKRFETSRPSPVDRALRSKRNGGIHAQPAPALDDKKAQDETKARDEESAQAERRLLRR